MKFITWINTQIEWVKSFISEPDGKGSNKRILSTAVVTAFLVPYLKVSLSTQKLEDIPPMWALMIGSIIGLNIVDYFVKGYINKTVEKKNDTGTA